MTAIQLEHFLSELRACVGAAHVLTQALDTWSYTEDWRKKYHGKALAVVSPGSTEEVAAVMKAACTYKVPVVTQGGNTGLSGGATPDDSDLQIVLSTRRLNRIRHIDTANDAVIVEAGVVLQVLQDAALECDRLFPMT